MKQNINILGFVPTAHRLKKRWEKISGVYGTNDNKFWYLLRIWDSEDAKRAAKLQSISASHNARRG